MKYYLRKKETFPAASDTHKRLPQRLGQVCVCADITRKQFLSINGNDEQIAFLLKAKRKS